MFATYHPVVCSTTIIVSFAVCLLICSQTALDSKRCVGFSFVMWMVPSFLFEKEEWESEWVKSLQQIAPSTTSIRTQSFVIMRMLVSEFSGDKKKERKI